jgi:beta-1,4-mannosyl-glycoprotein beta-1,4-N-acetylglucosaminyltransferase
MDMLLYRLSLLYDIVDTFVLVEATLTHRGTPKRLFYNENKHLFRRFEDKIVHIIHTELNPNPIVNVSNRMDDDVWKNENDQRNAIDKGLLQLTLEPKDILIVGDVDEIPNPEVLRSIRANNYNIDYVSLSQDIYYYNLTVLNSQKWFLAKLVSYDYYVKQLGRVPQQCRNIISKKCIERGGWHMSYFGDVNFIQNKLKQFSHQEFNEDKYTNVDEIQRKIDNKGDLFSRTDEKWIHIPIEQNQFLPTNYPSSWVG